MPPTATTGSPCSPPAANPAPISPAHFLQRTLSGPRELSGWREALADIEPPGGGAWIHADLFGDAPQIAAMGQALDDAGVAVPRTAVLSYGREMAGLQLAAVSGARVEPVKGANGRLLGFRWEDDFGAYCFLGGLLPERIEGSREEQAESVFAAIEAGMAAAGMTFREVFRTWFYNDDILGWYREFNDVRTRYFRKAGVSLMPASTGIGAPNPSGAALVAKAFGAIPRGDGLRVRRVESPLQGDAFSYGSAFSRGVAVESPGRKQVFVSGTASIDHEGRTTHRGDAEKQIATTFEVVDAILRNEGLTYADTTRAIAYFRDPSDLALWETLCREKGIAPLPCVAVGSFVCRDDLLFELELDAERRP
jgi:enamine deaminase RidA (YjgF/YER057c/UK114 family)